MNEHLKSSLSALVEESKLYPQEKVAPLKRNRKILQIGIPKEISTYENRAPLTPKAVGALTDQGHRILVQTGLGQTANFLDKEYAEAGADIVSDPKEVFKSELILKVEFPGREEINLINSGKTVESNLTSALITGNSCAVIDTFLTNWLGETVFCSMTSNLISQSRILLRTVITLPTGASNI